MNRELIVDNFAGGGGASTGIEMAIGRSVDIAINHDPNAIAMHTTNHPDTLHYCESVFDIDPVAATAGRPVGLAWFSPDCRHFSKAKGSKPVKKEIRGLAWIVIRWALRTRFRCGMLENVEEFKTWGPLVADADGNERPCPARSGETFAAFVSMLTTGIDAAHPALAECCEVLGIADGSDDHQRLVAGLGYVVDHRELRACDYGAPTIRRRFFMVMRCDGIPVAWPEATHGDPKSPAVQAGKLKPWRTAAECIDWSIPCPSIFERQRPLAENTLKRIARGIQRFVLDNPAPFIVKCNHTSNQTKYDCFRGQELEAPLQTITKTHGYALVAPHITKFRTGATGQECDAPISTITAGSSERPGGNGHALGMVEAKLAPFIAGAGGSEYQGKPRPVDQPLHTVLKESHAALVTPYIARIGQTGFGGDRMAYDAQDPLTTVTSKAEHLLVAPLFARQFGASVGHGADEPNGTITAGGGGKSQLVSAFLAKHFGGNYTGPGVALDEPAHTVTTTDHHALVSSHLVKLRGTCKDGQPVTEPMPTITAGGLHIGEVRAHLVKKEENNDSDGSHQKHAGPWCVGSEGERGDLETSGDNQKREFAADNTTENGMPDETRLSGRQGLYEQQAVSGSRSPSGVGGAARANPGRDGYQPHGWEQKKQSPGKSGSCDKERKSDACSQDGAKAVQENCSTHSRRSDAAEAAGAELCANCHATGGLADHGLPGHAREVIAFITKYYSNEKEGLNIGDPLHTVTSRDRFGLITVEGVDYQIVDIGMRMLQPHELYAAQGFPGWYIIDQDYRGVKYAKDKQVARCGNAVPPPFAEALVRANLPELCKVEEEAAA